MLLLSAKAPQNCLSPRPGREATGYTSQDAMARRKIVEDGGNAKLKPSQVWLIGASQRGFPGDLRHFLRFHFTTFYLELDYSL